jgi:Zn-dependent protease
MVLPWRGAMLGRRIKLFKLFGFEVQIDLSWVIIAVLVVWSLAVGFFPFRYKYLSVQTYWVMGVVGAIGFFLSVIFHEIFHSLVARKFGIPMKGLTSSSVVLPRNSWKGSPGTNGVSKR